VNTIFAAPTTAVGWRAAAWVVGSLLVALAVTGVATPLGPAVPLALLLTVASLAVALTSSWHGLFVVLPAVVLLPVPFSVALGPVTVSAGRAMLFALVIGWLVQRGRAGALPVPRSPLGAPVFALLAVMAASTIVNVPRMAGFELSGAFRKLGVYGVDYALLFFIALTVMIDEARLLRVVRVVAGLIVTTAVLGIVEYQTGRNVFEFLAPYLPGGVGRFISELAQASVLTRGEITRVRSTLEQPLAFGSLLLLGLPLTIALSLIAGGRRGRLWWGLGATAIGAAVLLTAGRSIYLIAGLGVVSMLLLLPERRGRGAILAVVAVVVLLFLSNRDVRDTMIAFFQPRRNGTLEGSIQARVNDYRPVLDRVGERPLLGFGPRSFALDELRRNELLPDPDDLVLDNAYLLQLAENGVTGVVALVGVLTAGVVTAWRSARQAATTAMSILGLGLFIAIAGWVLMGFAADIYLFNAPPRVFFVLLAAACTARRLSGWSRAGGQPRLDATARGPAAAGPPALAAQGPRP
jgi:polysaccharide biosynthesis protein PslJ